jgi:hypothetical protein
MDVRERLAIGRKALVQFWRAMNELPLASAEARERMVTEADLALSALRAVARDAQPANNAERELWLEFSAEVERAVTAFESRRRDAAPSDDAVN